jgi:sugar phosphate isomerase/epimerase
MSKLAPSVQLYTVRDAIAEDLPGAIAKVAAAGFTQVEPYGFVDRADEFVAALKANGLTAPTGHAKLIGEDIVPILEAAKKLGIKTLIDPFTLPEFWTDAEAIKGFAEALNAAAVKAEAYGITIGYHNHNWEFSNRIDGEIALDYFISLHSPSIVLEIDTFWCEVGGVSALDYLKKLGSRVVALHIKDGDKDGDVAKQVPAGTGQIPVREVLAAAPHALPVVEFDLYTGGDVFDGIAQSLKFVNEVRG